MGRLGRTIINLSSLKASCLTTKPENYVSLETDVWFSKSGILNYTREIFIYFEYKLLEMTFWPWEITWLVVYINMVNPCSDILGVEMESGFAPFNHVPTTLSASIWKDVHINIKMVVRILHVSFGLLNRFIHFFLAGERAGPKEISHEGIDSTN